MRSIVLSLISQCEPTMLIGISVPEVKFVNEQYSIALWFPVPSMPWWPSTRLKFSNTRWSSPLTQMPWGRVAREPP